MDQIKNILLTAIVTTALVLGGLYLIQQNPRDSGSVPLGGDLNRYTKTATSTATTVGTASSQILATSSPRLYVAIVNTGTNAVCLSLNQDAPAVNCQGIYLAASGGSYEILPENLYTGAITAIAVANTSRLTILQATSNQ